MGARRGHHGFCGNQHHSAAMRLDPNTHAYVVATAFFTSLAFAIFAMNLIAVLLSYALR
jgi:hypothetical protein